VLASTGIGSFVTSANLSTVNIAFRDIGEAFPDASLASLQWVVSAYTIAFAAVLLPAGRLADAHGRRRTFFAGLALFALGALATGVAPTLLVVVIGRAIQGIGGALIVPASLGLLLEASPPDEMTRSVALYGGITAVGVATGPTIGALVVEHAGWRWSFLLSLPFAAAAWALGVRDLSRARVGTQRAIDVGGIALVALAMSAVSLGIAEGRSWGWTSPAILTTFAVGIAAGALFVRRCGRHPAPILPLDLFRIRSFALSTSATVLFGVSTGAILLTNVLFLTGIWEYSIVRAGLAMAPSPVVAALSAPFVGRIGSRFGERTMGVPGALILAASTVWFRTHAGPEPNYWIDWFPGAVMSGLGINMAFPMLQSCGVRDVGPDRFSVANASTRAALQVGTAIGVAGLVSVLGGSAASIGRFHTAWLLIALFAAGSAALILPIRKRSAAPGTVPAGAR
jgi:EmrB/QacA subfamily drug resistance transporter